jgi:competence protein ComFC
MRFADISGCRRCGRRGRSRRECPNCATLFPANLKQVRSGFVYEGPVRQAIQRFKYNGEYQRGYDLGVRLSDRFATLMAFDRIDYITPVPLHARRYRARGFNQSTIIAKCLGEASDVPVVLPLIRARNTSPQVGLSADQRLQNLQHAFAIDPSFDGAIEGKSFLLVDDVLTTGATIAAAASTLEESGAGNLYGITVAREN